MKMKNWMRNAGFTLVELIVVIAVLGILGAGAAVGYSGYVKKANKAADQQMVAEIVYALELAAISDPSSVPGDATLFLDTTGARVTGSDSAGMSAALENAYGSNFASQLKLQYGQWGLGSTVTAQAKKLVENPNYEGGLSYTDNVDDLWGEVETILTGLEDVDVINKHYGSNATLMADAAKKTLSEAAEGDGNPMENFASLWCDINNPFANFGQGYTSGSNFDKDALDSALINAAALKARNYAFGNYLMSRSTSTDNLKAAAQKMMISKKDGSVIIPTDFMYQLANPQNPDNCFSDCQTDDLAELRSAIKDYFGATCAENSLTFTTATDPTTTQAYRDAMGYYTLMSAVNEAASETSGMDNDTYKKTMAAAVHNTGVLLNDRDILDHIKGGCVAITVRDGSIWVTPQEIYIGGSDVGDGVGKSTAKLNDTVTVEVSYVPNEDFFVGVAKGSTSMVLRVGETGHVVLEAGQGLEAYANDNNYSIDDLLKDLMSLRCDDDSITIENGSITAIKAAKNVRVQFAEISTFFTVTVVS